MFCNNSNQEGLNTLVHIITLVSTGIYSEFLFELTEFTTKTKALLFTEVHFILYCMHYDLMTSIYHKQEHTLMETDIKLPAMKLKLFKIKDNMP